MKNMNIVLAADDNYAVPCMVTIASLLENNDQSLCKVFVMTKGFNDANTQLFNKLQSRYPDADICIRIIDVNKLRGSIVSERFPIANFFRLLVPEILDDDKALYMDCDIIVTGDISDLYNTDLTNNVCGLVEDQACEDITLHNRIHTFTPYYNAGVLLMNLTEWRKQNVAQKLVNFMHDYPERCLYPDQDAINACYSNSIVRLNYKYNFQERWFEPQEQWLMHRDKWDAINDAKKSPAILHYTGQYKPWMAQCSHPLSKLYFKYKKFVIEENRSEEEDELRTQQEQARRADEIARKKRHRHIRRANLFTILFAVETLLILMYFIFR